MTEIWCDGTHNEKDLMKILMHNIIVNHDYVSNNSKYNTVESGLFVTGLFVTSAYSSHFRGPVIISYLHHVF